MSLNFLKQNSPQSKIRQQKLPHQVLLPIVPLGPIHPLGHINVSRRRSPPPVTAATIRRSRLVTISFTVGAVHLLRSCCPSAFANPSRLNHTP